MFDLDFAGLRRHLEAITRVPEFAVVERRAHRTRTRSRLAVAGAMAATVAMVAPVGLAASRARQAPNPTTLSVDQVVEPPDPDASPAPPPAPPVVTIRAVAGVDLDNLYAAVDVCAASTAAAPAATGPGAEAAAPAPSTRCSLQVAPLPLIPGERAPLVVGQLRDSPDARLDGVDLVALTPRSLLLSGVVSGTRQYSKVGVTGGASSPAAPSGPPETLGGNDRPVQLAPHGEVYAATTGTDRLTRIPAQPPVGQPTVVTAVAPHLGWWVVGTDAATGAVAVAVSRDQGRTWTARPLGVAGVEEPPTLATADGRTVFVFLRTAAGVQQWRSTDGGVGWQRSDPPLPWPQAPPGARFGAVVRPDGSPLLWLDSAPAPVYLESTDGGRTYRATAGPSGRVVPVPGGFVLISAQPQVSRDGRTWAPLPAPAFLPPG